MSPTANSVLTLPPLLPAQSQALAALERVFATERVAILNARNGIGKTVILRALHAKIGGAYLTSLEFVEASIDRLSGADLKRVVEDGKLLSAFERERQALPRAATTYFLKAIETVLTNKAHYAKAEAAARMRHPGQRPPHFDGFGMMAHMASMGGSNFAMEMSGMNQSHVVIDSAMMDVGE